MYEELVERLREVARFSESRGYSGMANTTEEAADAIEELQRKINELYLLAQDVNRKEIAGHISENNLDTWLYAFHRYAAKIAREPLPEPPKEEK